MAGIPSKVESRLIAGLKRFQPILEQAKARDVNEADTVTIVKDLLADLFGYDKYMEVTSEHAIRGTYCDLAIKLDGQVSFLIEVKAIGLDLKDQHVKQAVDYAAHLGVEWALLTNGVVWRVYRVVFAQPLQFDLVVEIRALELSPRNSDHLELLWLLAKEGWQKARIGEFHAQRQAVNRYTIAALIMSAPIVDSLRKELRRLHNGIKITNEQISEVLQAEVLKRETLDGEKATEARKTIVRVHKKLAAPKKSVEAEIVIPQTVVEEVSKEPPAG
ncbi:type I restriction enzyme HsdR N-terminal domain-containing protein [Solimonas marina]|uniref:Restriction endonuclease subunit R n=1 Tax=Solimonas marina TaxID=2714601 RepID=A0A970BA64_9GAMM|nr:type I restriction enzyme HsdR N-terminal domain-containing protein [Solimonas marina]NKF23061.1 restriction endonuclease subunit R [Solimonas marina]